MDKGRIVQHAAPARSPRASGNDFVAVSSGTGLGLELLSVRRIADRLRRDETAEGDRCSRTSALRDTLSAMTARHAESLPVADAAAVRSASSPSPDLVR